MGQVQLSGIRSVVFDLDDTLYSERDFAFSGFHAVSKWLRRKIACAADPEPIMQSLFDSPHRGKVFDQLLIDLDCDQQQAILVPQMVECFRTHSPSITLRSDAESAINRWRGRFILGLISDGTMAIQQRKVHALGLDSLLDTIILTDRWGRPYWKPHTRGFTEIEKIWQISGQACLYIADNPRKDFIAPVQLGWQTVRICRSEGIYCQEQPAEGGNAEFQVSSLDQIELSS